MKQGLFTLADEEFMTLLERTHNAFSFLPEVSYSIVGGVGVQTHIAYYLNKINNKDLLTLAQEGHIRLQDYLRATDDVDIALSFKQPERTISSVPDTLREAKIIYEALERIVGESFSPTEQHIISIKMTRPGHARPKFELSYDGTALPEKEISFNIYHSNSLPRISELKEFEKHYYKQFIDNAKEVSISYAPSISVTLRVKKPEDILAAKIARGRSKDITDALGLVTQSRNAGEPLNLEYVKEILCTSYDGKFPNQTLCDRYEAFINLEQTLNRE